MNPDEFIGRTRLGFVTSGFQYGKVCVIRHHKIRFRRNRTVAEFIVVRIGRDDGEAKLRLDLSDIAVKLVEQFQQRLDPVPTLRAG